MIVIQEKIIEGNESLVKEDMSLYAMKLAPGEVILGTFIGLDDQHNVMINFPDNHAKKPIVATTTIKLKAAQSGSQVALMFVDGDIEKPLVMGLIYNPLDEALESFELNALDNLSNNHSHNNGKKQNIESESSLTKVDDTHVDGKRIVLEGKEEIVLKCGEASITLTKEGKILIRGKYLLNRSTGVNRILGGSVQVN